ncbi:MAG: VCBS repeat-containing protein, partial [Opitutales bacterium]
MAAFLLASAAAAQADPQNFRFAAPEVVKLDWNAKCLVAKDLNGDAKVDLAVVNVERSRIEIFYRRKPGEKVSHVRSTTPDRWDPDLEDAPYLRETVPFDGDFANLVAADLDLDGRPDLIYGGDGEGVVVRFREKNNSWSEPLELDARDPLTDKRSLAVRDLDGDGLAELLVFSDKGLERITFDGRKPKNSAKIQKLSSANARGFRFVDYDGDGDDDLLYLASKQERSLRALRWSASGFLSESSHPLDPQSLALSKSVPAALGKLAFASIDGDSGELVTFRMGRPLANEAAKKVWKPRIRNLFDEKDGAFLHALADFDGDGFLDLAAVAPKEAELRFLRGRKDGEFESYVAFPFLRG